MSWATAKAAIDYILMHEDFFKEESVIWDFIGGEPFLEIELIDKICDYLKTEMFRLNHHWFNSYRFSFSTNGINYDSPKVQNFIYQLIVYPKDTCFELCTFHFINSPMWQSLFPGQSTNPIFV